MRVLVSEKLSPHKMKTSEGYLICTDAILSRTGQQTYYRSEIWGDSCNNPNDEVLVDRTAEEVFNDKTLASFENKPICLEHPDEDVNVNNYNELSVGFVRDIKRGTIDGQDVMLGTLVITDADAIEAVERGEYTELSCGYNCDIVDEDNPQQRNIRGNHVALCRQGRAGIAKIVDSVDDMAKLSAEESATLKAMIEGGAGKRLYERLSYNKPVSIHLTQEDKELLRWHRDENQYLTNEEKALLKKLVGDSKVKDSEYHQIDMTDPWGGTRSLIVKAFSFEEAKKKAEKFKPEWKFRAAYQASKADVDSAKRRGLYIDSVDDAGIKVWQVRQGYAIVVKRYWQQYGKNAFVDATESSIEAARYHRGSLERNDKMDFVIIDCNDGKYKIEDSEMKDIQSTKAPGTDKIIYVMQSDIDKNLYFYIGKTFSMKEGAWGYTKFEMGNTTPEQLKAELSKNGWHAVSQGVARIIDAEHEVVTDEIMKDESRQTLIEKLRTVSVPYGERYALTSGSGWHIDIQHHGQASYENINKYPHTSPKESSKATIRLWYNGKHMKTFEGPLNSAKSDAIRYLQTRTEDSWSSVEEENYNKANKPVGAKDADKYTFKLAKRKNDYDEFVIRAYKNGKYYEDASYYTDDWEDAVGTLKDIAKRQGLTVKQNGTTFVADAKDSKEQLFTVEYEQDGVTYVRKIRASSMKDAIRHIKDLQPGVLTMAEATNILRILKENYQRVMQATWKDDLAYIDHWRDGYQIVSNEVDFSRFKRYIGPDYDIVSLSPRKGSVILKKLGR